MAKVSSQEIMEATGIQNSVTLTRWHQMNLIPKPIVETHPSGRGKMSYWPEWVLQRCLRIKQLRAKGIQLDAIKEFLGTDWKTESDRYAKSYNFAENQQRRELEDAQRAMATAVNDLLQDWVSGRHWKSFAADVADITPELVAHAADLAEQGYNPLLVLTCDSVEITTDFALADYFANHRDLHDSVMIIPIAEVFHQHLHMTRNIPETPAVRPVNRVIISSPKGELESNFTTVDEWSFEVAPVTHLPKSRRR